MSHTAGPLVATNHADSSQMFEIFRAHENALNRPKGKRIGVAYLEANAILWAASPNLLEACKAAEIIIREMANELGSVFTVHYEDALEQIRAAIAEAEE